MQATHDNNTVSILARAFEFEDGALPTDIAKGVLRLRFRDTDLDRMHDLAQRNQMGTLSRTEEEELADYRSAAYLIDILRARARLALKKAGLCETDA